MEKYENRRLLTFCTHAGCLDKNKITTSTALHFFPLCLVLASLERVTPSPVISMALHQ